ncbi:MAG TPA: TlpA disulfide reductase family protein [Candidatus Limnocylindrales bacterium]
MSDVPEPVAARARTAPRYRVGPFSLRQVTLVIGVVAVVAVVLTLANAPLGRTGTNLPIPEPGAYLLSSPIPGLNRGDQAPELAVTRADGTTYQLVDLDGNPVRLADLRGKVVWLNFWASWCPPCQSETPLLRQMDEQYRDRGLALIGVQVQQTVDDGRRYAATYSLEYRIGADVTGEIFREYRVFALPTQFFIDANGIVRAVVNGPMTEESATNMLDALLPGASPAASPGSS